MLNNALLEVQDIYVSYTKYAYQVLKGINLKVQKGQIVCLIGPNGAGKSTVFRTIFGILHANPGRVVFKGEDITNKNPPEILRKGISYVFQESSVFPSMTVYENLEMGAFIQNDREQFEENLERLYRLFPILKEKKDKIGGTLSGGQRRMLEVGRALLLDPDVILMDEPSVGLAPKIRDPLFEKIVEINKEDKITIIIVEQNAKLALKISDYTYLLVDGKNRTEGTPKEILENTDIRRLYLGG